MEADFLVVPALADLALFLTVEATADLVATFVLVTAVLAAVVLGAAFAGDFGLLMDLAGIEDFATGFTLGVALGRAVGFVAAGRAFGADFLVGFFVESDRGMWVFRGEKLQAVA